MSEEHRGVRGVIESVIKSVDSSPNTYDRKDLWQIITGKKKSSSKYDFKISKYRFSGVLDSIELFRIVCRNEKGLYSVVDGGKERFDSLNK